MKRVLAVCLCILLLACSTAPAFAANKDLVVTKDTTINPSFVKYGNITVKSGATLTIKSTSGFEITGALTVEPGAALISDGEGKGQFNFAMKGRGSSISGIPLYFRSRDDGLVKEIPGGWAFIAGMDMWDWDAGCPAFKWNNQVKGWCLSGDMQDALMGVTLYHTERDRDVAERMTVKLNGLGLVAGAGKNPDGSTNYALYRKGKRVEALVMLIRLLGKEEEALSGTWHHPFTDVPTWPGADNYIGYAYEHDLVGGVADDKFGTDTPATIQMFATFVLRAMGYTDDTRGGTDFTYAGAVEFAMQRGIVAGEADISGFNRGTCVKMMESALHQSMKTGEPLWQKLAGECVFTEADYKKVFG
jgi:hypothetical protein